MTISNSILTVNSSFPEMEHLAAGLAAAGLLSYHVRPYTNKRRGWERTLSKLPFVGSAYGETIGRRKTVSGLPDDRVKENAVIFDFGQALTTRLLSRNRAVRSLNTALLEARSCSIAQAGAKTLGDEKAVIASWGVAKCVFKKMQKRGGLRVLNYSFAHHAFVKNFLLNEADHEPHFADTLDCYNWPDRLEDRINNEIDLADKILLGSSFARDSFLSQGIPKEKLVVLPYGVNTHLFSPTEPHFHRRKRLRILFVGQIGQRKGISYLLKAFKKFREPSDSLTLVGQIQGNGRALSPWWSLFKHINHCPHTELCKIYQESDVFLFPTLIEGMGLVVLEAMASGLPVITTPNGPGDIVRDGVDGFIVPPRDVETITDRLHRLRNDPGFRSWMGNNARKRAMSFDWKTYRRTIADHVQRWIRNTLKSQT